MAERNSAETRGNDRRVLVTGAGGFVGRPCVDRLLAEGWRVEAVTSQAVTSQAVAGNHDDSASRGIEIPRYGMTSLAGRGAGEVRHRVRWHQCDLLDASAVGELIASTRPSHLLHLAWYMGSDLYGSPENQRWVTASAELLQAFADAGGERVVSVGSCAEYDWKHGFCTEAITPLRPASEYGRAKRALSERFERIVESHDALSGAWARLFFLYGPHEQPRRLLASVIRSLLHGEPARCSHGQQRRDYLFTLDAADALVALLSSGLEGAINLASGQSTRLEDLIRGTARRLGREDLIELGAVPVPENEAPLVLADVRRMRRELRWRPGWDVDRALDHTIDWWRAREGAVR